MTGSDPADRIVVGGARIRVEPGRTHALRTADDLVQVPGAAGTVGSRVVLAVPRGFGQRIRASAVNEMLNLLRRQHLVKDRKLVENALERPSPRQAGIANHNGV